MRAALMLSSLLLSGLLLEASQLADVRISNTHLQIACLDARPVEAGRRKWDLPERAVSMTFTMRNRPRAGRTGAAAGFASIDFTPQPGHVYEIEVRSDPMRYSERVWPKGEWRAVVRDRTTDQIISGEPQWSDSPPCGR